VTKLNLHWVSLCLVTLVPSKVSEYFDANWVAQVEVNRDESFFFTWPYPKASYLSNQLITFTKTFMECLL